MSQQGQSEIKFGTDGWRGVISDNFTFTNVSVVAQALSEWVNKDLPSREGKKNVVIGYDARFLSEEYAQIVACVLAQNGIGVYLSKEMVPTPALSYGVIDIKGVCGVMITASHNPAKFNGIKIKTAEGGGAGTDITNKVEEYLFKTSIQSMPYKAALEQKKIILHDFKKAYLKFMRDYVDLKKIRSSKFTVVQDAMHGSGVGILSEILKGSKVKFSYMRDIYNPSFGRVKPEPLEENIPDLIGRTKKEKIDLGLVLDGDADRISAVAPGGEYIHPQKILGLLALHLIRNKKRSGGIVKTICGTMMMDNIAQKLGVKLYETPVGFKYISELMVKENIVAGGEEAGGMGVQDYIPERDGNLAGLLLLEMMVYQKKNMKQILHEMEKEFGRYYYQRADITLDPGVKVDLNTIKSIKEILGKRVIEMKDYDGVKFICEDGSWVMLRPSGTEPLVRAYSESKSLAHAKALLKFAENLLKANS